MQESTDNRLSDEHSALLSLLEWYRESGVDEILLDQPVVRLAEPPAPETTGRVRRAASAPVPVQPDRVPIPGPSLAREIAQAAATLDDLRSALQQFEGCALKRTAMNLVFGDGNPEADVMLIGEAPGADEDRQGRPFVGPSGMLLDRMIASIGLDRTSVYISNILPWRPPGNRDPAPIEVASCLPFIHRHIEIVAPRVIVLVGGTAAKTLLDREEGIIRLRGRWLNYRAEGSVNTIPALPMLHPAYLLRTPIQKANAWRDMLTLRKKLRDFSMK